MTNQRRRKNKLRESEYRGAVCGDSAVAIHGRRVQITVNRVLRARGKLLRGKSNGPADCLVVEMLSRLPTEVIYEVTHWFQKRFALVFLKKPDARLEKGLRGFGAIALLSVFVLVDLLHEEKEPIEWMSLHVGAERGVNCEHVQQKHVKTAFSYFGKLKKDLKPEDVDCPLGWGILVMSTYCGV